MNWLLIRNSNKTVITETKSKKSAQFWITLYSDASSDNFSSGWAIWLRSSRGQIIRRGKCPEGLTDSNGAELYAALMGIQVALEEWGSFQGVFINSDNITVCRYLWPWSNQIRNKKIAKIQNQIRELCSKNKIKIRTKHVKGHQNPSLGVREFLNNEVDKLSRESRRDRIPKNRETITNVTKPHTEKLKVIKNSPKLDGSQSKQAAKRTVKSVLKNIARKLKLRLKSRQ